MTAAAIKATPVIAPSGNPTQSNSETRLTAIEATSKRENGAGNRRFSWRASQLRVKLGTTRPPTSVARVMTASGISPKAPAVQA
jgi:hypothetical protein